MTTPENAKHEELQALAQEAPRAGFRALLALLERLLPEGARIGGDGPVLDERVRLRHAPSLAFGSGDVAGLVVKEHPAPSDDFTGEKRAYVEVSTTFLGLSGAVTPLPYYLAEEVAQEEGEQGPKRDFLDLFHHRLLSLLYRTITKYDLSTRNQVDGEDAWSKRILALTGQDDRPTTPLERWRLLRWSALLGHRGRTAESLRLAIADILSDVLEGTTVRLREFAELQSPIPREQVFQLGRKTAQLGRSALLGSHVTDRSSAFTLELGPVSFEVFERLRPGRDLAQRIEAVVSVFTREPLEALCDVTLKPETLPRFQLGQERGGGLGRGMWLGKPLGKETRQVRTSG